MACWGVLSIARVVEVGAPHHVTQRGNNRQQVFFSDSQRGSGHLWQNRFFSCALGRDHLVTAPAYVDLNPVRAGLVGCGEQYPWSSARAYLNGRDGAGLVDFASWREVRGCGDWEEVLRGTALENECRRLRQATTPDFRSARPSLCKIWRRTRAAA